ncbi:MAG: copper resistance protein CopC/CopD [Gemmatimonadaceae bacterium]|nr:copper resistance protein CopC/CopD [Gemmatimonadaceae bacterium]
MSALRGGLRALVIGALMMAVAHGVAWAHARLVRAVPASGAHVPIPPTDVRLEFSESVVPRTSRVDLVGPDSQRLGLMLRADIGDSTVLLAAVPPLSRTGEIRVEWRLVGPDGHAVTGEFGFTVDSLPAAQSVDTTPAIAAPDVPVDAAVGDSGIQSGIRFLSLLAMVVVIGSIAFALFVVPGVSDLEFRRAIASRVRALCVAGAWVLLGLAMVRLLSHGIVLGGSLDALRLGDLADLIAGSTWGRGWLLQVAATLALLSGLRSERPWRWWMAGSVTLALGISAPMLGHPAAVVDMPILAMGLDAVHGLTAGGWAGGILMLAFAALPLVRSLAPDDRVAVIRELLRAFSPLALSCAAALLATGVAGAWLQLRDISLVFDSPYGFILFRKVVVVGLIVVVGAYHWRIAQPSLGTERSMVRLRVSVAIDVLLVLTVVVLTALLTGTAPPTGSTSPSQAPFSWRRS